MARTIESAKTKISVWMWYASALCLIALFLRVEGVLWMVCMLAAAGAGLWLIRKPERFLWRHTSLWQRAAAGLLACCYVYYFVAELEGGHPAGIALAILGLPAMWLFLVRVIHSAVCVLHRPVHILCRRPYIWLFCLMAVAIVIAYSQTTMFYRPMIGGYLMRADRLFTMDNGVIVQQNTWMDLAAEENDMRQPLFALFSMPFAIPLWLLGRLIPAFPDFYLFALALVQWGLLLLSYGMLCDMAEEACRMGLLLVLALSYPTLIFMLGMEQYIFSVFWMIAYLYAFIRNTGGRKLLCIACTGSLLTTGFWEPLVAKEKSWKSWLTETAMTFGGAVWLIVGSGKLKLLDELAIQTERYGSYFGNVSMPERLLQYINFIGSCLMAPATRSHELNGTWLLAPVTGINLMGAAVLILSVLGVIWFRKQIIIRFCTLWMCFSHVLLCLLGWGSAENGMILYTLYFGWAFLLPAWMAAWKITAPLGRGRKWMLAVCGVAILAVNGLDLLGLLRFARRIYPR